MKVLVEGHRYVAEGLTKGQGDQTIQFIQKEPIEGGNGEMRTLSEGTTNEELLTILLDRCKNLYNKFPSDETARAIDHMSKALWELESRTRNRIARGVEGKHIK